MSGGIFQIFRRGRFKLRPSVAYVPSLFAAGEQGAWYDPSDLSTLFQDSAGTTPVTAVEQPVGRILDKSGRGNHATQSTTTKRPVYSRRVNLLTNSEFVGAVAGTPGTPPTGWINSATTGGITAAPTGVRFVAASARRTINHAFTISPNGVLVARVNGVVHTSSPAAQVSNIVGNTNPAVIASASYKVNGVAVASNYVMSVGTFDIECTLNASASGGSTVLLVGLGVQGNATGDVTFLTASLTLATDAHLPYQLVNTATAYDADPSKFPAYLRFDGVDDALQTGNIDFTSTANMTVWAGVTKLSDAAPQAIAELGNSPITLAGTFWINANSLATGDIWSALASSVSERAGRSFPAPAPSTGVLSTAYEFAGATREDEIKPRWNGAVPVLTGGLLGNAGSGPFGTHPLYIGARAGTSVFFNGRLYSLIVLGAQTPLSQIEATELYIKQKMRMP